MDRGHRRVLLDVGSIKKTRPKKCCFCIPWYCIRRFIRGSRSHEALRRTQTPWHSRNTFEEDDDNTVYQLNDVEMLEENGNSLVSVNRSPSQDIELSELKYDAAPEFAEKNSEQ